MDRFVLTVRTEYTIGAITNSKNPKFAFGEFLPKLSAKPRPLSPRSGDHSPLSLIRRSRIRDHSQLNAKPHKSESINRKDKSL